MTDSANYDDLMPAAQSVAGPYYGNGGPPRRDIRDDIAGAPMTLRITLVDLATRAGLADAVADIWHADSKGRYSGYDNDPDKQPESVVAVPPDNDETFLRGSQISDADGRVEFLTVFPGWYATRTPHIHLKVFHKDNNILTTQLFIPDSWQKRVYATPEYRRAATQDTENKNDTVIAMTPEPIDGCWLDIQPEGDGFLASSVLGVDLNARSIHMDPPPDWRPPLGGMSHSQKVR